MLYLESHEKNIIRLAQRKIKKHKKNGGTIICPFAHTVDTLERLKWFGNVAHDVCVLCHKWMGTDFDVYTHPCNDLRITDIRNRFWRNPDDEYPIGKQIDS